MDIDRLARTTDTAPVLLAEALINLMRRGLVKPDHGTVEDAVTDLLRRYPDVKGVLRK